MSQEPETSTENAPSNRFAFLNFAPKALAQYALISLACWGMLWYTRPRALYEHHPASPISLQAVTLEDDLNPALLHLDANDTLDNHPVRPESTVVLYTDNLVHQNEEDDSVTAILPVTQSSLASMLSTLTIILQSPGKVTDIVLVCPANIQATVRHALRHFLYSSEFLVYVDIDLSIWHPEDDVGTAVLSIARQLTARTFLLLDTDGLAELRPQNVGLLVSPTVYTLPLGPRAADLSGADFVCFTAPKPDIGGYLVPPFILPAKLLPAENVTADVKIGFWGALGKDVSSVTGMGGVVYGTVEAGNYHCSSEHRHKAFISSSSIVYETTSYPDEDPLITVGGSAHYATTDNPGTFIFVFPSVKDLRLLYPVVCRLQEEGHRAYSIVSPDEKETITPIDSDVPSDAFTHLEDCDIDITVFPDADTLDDMATSLWAWIVSLPSPADVVVVPNQRHRALDALEIMRNWRRDFDAPVIRIPHSDLPFCDWMGALSLDEWLSKLPKRCGDHFLY